MDFDSVFAGDASGDALKNQAARLALMSDVVLLMAKTDDVAKLLSDAIGKIKWVVDFDRCTLALLNDEGTSYDLHILLETRRDQSRETIKGLPVAEALAGQVIRSGRMALLTSADEVAGAETGDAALALGISTVLSVPLQAYGRSLGAITFGSSRENVYAQGDIDIVRAFSTHLALALDRRRYIRQVEQANADLLDEVSRRKRAEEEAGMARRAAENANKAKSTFLANMSHELRTPLNAIIGYSEMLKEEAADIEAGSFLSDLDKILAAGKHLLALINDILDLSKIEAGRMDVFNESFSVASLVSDVAVTIQPLVAKNDNVLKVEIDDSLESMHADLTKVRQILFNLLSNACKFTEKGTVELGARRVTDARGDQVEFLVSDSGIGMTAAQADKLFEPFTQADASTTRQYGGTGLGLAISRRFCEMMGGSISLESKPGEGSTFTVRLPVSMDATVAHPGSGVVHSDEATGRDDDSRPAVLVIDDDPQVLDLMRRFLEKEGLRVVTASDGAEGIAKAKALKPAVITLDVLMPRVDGWSVLTQLKADRELAAIPVMMVTIVDDKNLAFSLGAAHYLTKPIDWSRLTALVARYRCGPGACRVLIVDDDADMRERVRRTLEKDGFEIFEAENGSVGLERLAERSPEVILLDLMMPEMDGFQFLEELQSNEEWARIPVVVVTSKDLGADDRRRLEGSVRRVLEKHELSMGRLASEVRELATTDERR